jgi:acyl-CoA synthetase (AMP-forming)/AMP-acid ligase II
VNIADVLLAQAAARPDATAILASHRGRDRAMTFAGLAAASAAVARQLRQAGLRPGEAVLLLVPMSPELYAVLVGLLRAGLVAMVLDPSAGRAHIDHCCALCHPAAFVGTPWTHALRLVSAGIRAIPRKFRVGRGWPLGTRLRLSAGAGSDARVVSLDPAAPALLTFTSGTTGLPKAAVRSHAFLLAQHRVLAARIRLTAGAVDLATLPVFVLANLGSGLTSVIPDDDLRRPGAVDAGPILTQARRAGVTRCTASPAFFERLLEHPEFGCHGWHALYTGGGPVPPSLLRRLAAASPGCDVVAVYGSTEAEPIAHLSLRELRDADLAAMRAGAGLLVGRPVPEIRLSVLADAWGRPLGPFTPDDFARRRLPPGEVGEIVVCGDHVLPGYWQGRGDTETKIHVGAEIWHRTGDAGYLDVEGRLWLVGRCAAVISDEFGTLHPFTVECVAMDCEWVRLAGCVVVGGRRWLAVQPRRAPCERELEALQGAVAWARLAGIRLVKRLPVDRRHNAKIDYQRLAREIWAALNVERGTSNLGRASRH